MDSGSGALIAVAKMAAEIALPEAMQGYLEKRRRRAFDIVVEELRTARIDPEEAAASDEVAAMFVKFYQAMAQGAAFSNLRAIAQILAGKAANASAPTDDFISWADSIAGLTYREVVFLAVMYRSFSAAYEQCSVDDIELARKQGRVDTYTAYVAALGDEVGFQTVGTGLLRTAFVTLVSLTGGLTFEPTEKLFQLAEMTRLDAWAEERLAETL